MEIPGEPGTICYGYRQEVGLTAAGSTGRTCANARTRRASSRSGCATLVERRIDGQLPFGAARHTERMTSVDLVPVTRADLPLLARWLAEPHVARFWLEPSDLPSVSERYGPALDGADPTELFTVRAAGRAVGMIQRYRLSDEPEWARALPAGVVRIPTAVGIDYFIGEPDALRHGYGSAAIALCSARSFAEPEVDQIVAAPQQANVASWRALERAGFSRLWAGQLDSDDPADAGPAYVYAVDRPASIH